MDYIFKIRSAVSAVTDTVSSVIPGNPVTREFTLIAQIASAGPGLMWKVFSGNKKSTQKAVSIWVFQKRDVERWPKREKELMVELLRKGVSQLTRLRHPRMLTVEHPLEESRDSLAFCTEPVYASLANLLGRVDNLPSPLPPSLSDFELEDIEIRHGLFQLSEALTFLHNDARMMHRNLTPESVIVNEKGSWKLAGFDFAVTNQAAAGAPADFPALEWTQDLMPVVQPQLDYLAPEIILGGRVDSAADMFSLGVLAFAVFSRGKTPTQNGNSLASFRKNASELKVLPPSLLKGLAEGIRDDVKMCLNFTPDLRPDATQFSKISYFDTPTMKTFNYLESLCQMDNNQKSQFFKGLTKILNRFPKRCLVQKIYPLLVAEFGTPELIPFILPSIFFIIEQTTDAEFAQTILPSLTPVFRLQHPFQIALLLLQNMELLLSKTPEAEVKAHLLPLVYQALESDTASIQELCLNIVPRISHLVDRDSMKNQLLPKLLKLSTTAAVLSVLFHTYHSISYFCESHAKLCYCLQSVKVNSLLCLGRLLDKLEKWMVTEQVLPTLPRTNSKEPAVLMATLASFKISGMNRLSLCVQAFLYNEEDAGIYKLAFENRNLGIAKEQLARSAIPYLVASSVESSLNLAQFEAFMSLIKTMIAKVEDEQRSRLTQLSAMQEEQRGGVPDFASMLVQSNQTQAMGKELYGLEAVAATQNGSKSQAPGKTQFDGVEGPLSLEEKRRLAKEQEESLRLKKQNPLVPESHGGGKPVQGAAFANKITADPLGLVSQNKATFPSFPSPPGAQSGPMGMTSPPGGGMRMLTMGQTGTAGTFAMGGGLMAQQSSHNYNPQPAYGAGFAAQQHQGSMGMGVGSGLGSLQPWGATPPRIGPPPTHPQPIRPPALMPSSSSTGGAGKAMDLSAFDSLCTMSSNSTPKSAPAPQKPKPTGAAADLSDFLS